MSLALLEGYSSAEEEEEDVVNEHGQFSSDEDERNGVVSKKASSYKPLSDPNPPSSSSLPSVFEAFSEISGPPKFLNNSVQEDAKREEQAHGGKRNRRDRKDLPAGAVMESKAQLVGIHERVRSDIGNSASQGGGANNSTAQGGKRVSTAGNPNAEDAADLLRICLKCGVPKTFSNVKGMVCPVCNDRPPLDSDKELSKKKVSVIKEKEKNKRMKGQSSHATWKSETEMQLRQQFD